VPTTVWLVDAGEPFDGYPMTLSRPFAMLRCGFFTTWQRWRHYMGEDRIGLLAPGAVANHFAEIRSIRACESPGPVDHAVLVDSRYWPSRAFVQLVRNLPLGGAIEHDGRLVAVAPDNAQAWLRDGRGHRWEPGRVSPAQITSMAGETERFTHLWELVEANPRLIEEDAILMSREWPSLLDRGAPEGVAVYAPEQILVSDSAIIDAHVCLDARDGPILIGENVHIQSGSRIEGPSALCNGSTIYGARIRSGTTVGPHCRVGGEIEQSIFQAYSNKYHDGFIGHAYIGEWVNLGALTTNSDLKNNYRTVRVQFPDRMVDTRLAKVGCFLGDHVKTGIGTLLNTGTVVGFASNVFGGGMPAARHIPSFSWGGAQGFEEFRLDAALEVAKAVLPRRDHKYTPATEALFRHVFESTRAHREGAGGLPPEWATRFHAAR
jgi:UDP-N-acetylglucosamine diphosphorylase / glucose-1-phosphate thymidylyltransferase / UDP-N-acetylgalactosamine diphosphorylase / glucosamine-1-phosphate N-acetyltransferase / galactosamine-1-phosphate N-acetyltransferase